MFLLIHFWARTNTLNYYAKRVCVGRYTNNAKEKDSNLIEKGCHRNHLPMLIVTVIIVFRYSASLRRLPKPTCGICHGLLMAQFWRVGLVVFGFVGGIRIGIHDFTVEGRGSRVASHAAHASRGSRSRETG